MTLDKKGRNAAGLAAPLLFDYGCCYGWPMAITDPSVS